MQGTDHDCRHCLPALHTPPCICILIFDEPHLAWILCPALNSLTSAPQAGVGDIWERRPVAWATAREHQASSQPASSAPRLPTPRRPAIEQQAEGRVYDGWSHAPRLNRHDFVHAVVTSQEHEHLALEGRMWHRVISHSSARLWGIWLMRMALQRACLRVV